jgi:hypothetical protein
MKIFITLLLCCSGYAQTANNYPLLNNAKRDMRWYLDVVTDFTASPSQPQDVCNNLEMLDAMDDAREQFRKFPALAKKTAANMDTINDIISKLATRIEKGLTGLLSKPEDVQRSCIFYDGPGGLFTTTIPLRNTKEISETLQRVAAAKTGRALNVPIIVHR